MDKIIKRITAFCMAVILITSGIPAFTEEALADGISDITIRETGRGPGHVNNGSGIYDILLTFPTPSGTDFQYYKVLYKNLTTGAAETEIGGTFTMVPNITANTISLTGLNLDSGCLYSFRVVPYYLRTVPSPGTDFIYAGPTISTYAALTTIEVDAIGEGNAMTVTFDMPTVGGGSFFSQYNIYYAILDNNTSNKLKWVQNPERVSANQLTVQGRKATYTYSHTDFIVGRVFAVKVVPVYNSIEVHNLPLKLSIGAGTYYFSSEKLKDYMTDSAYIRPNVYVESNSISNIDIRWDSLSGKPLSPNIDKINLWQYTKDANGNEESRIITFITGSDAQSQTTYSPERPTAPYAEYYIEVIYANIRYQMADSTTTPPYSLIVESKHGIYDPGAMEFAPYRPDIYEVNDNRAKPHILEITWKAFLREAYLDFEQADLYNATNKFLDKGVDYHIYITDDPSNFQSMSKAHAVTLQGSGLALEDIDNYPYYKNTFTKYYTRGVSGLVQKDLAQNKIYYIKITATRVVTNEVSEPAFGSHYIIPIDKIPIEPNTIAKPPLRVKTVDGAEVITDKSITIEWDEEWIEVYEPLSGKWYSKAGIINGSLVFGDDRTKYEDNLLLAHRVLESDGTINKALSFSRIKQALQPYYSPSDIIVLRLVDIKGSSYKLHNVEYNTVGEFGYDAYYDEISDPDTTYTWETITPAETGPITREYEVTTNHNPAGAMKEGTAYAIFLRPFVVSETGDKLAYYPSYVSSTTLKDRNPLDIDPVVPVLEPVGSTDTSITVRFEYIDDLDYEMRFSDLFTSYSEGGAEIKDEDIVLKGRRYNEDGTGKLYMEYTIQNLFPSTRYYIWIRSQSAEKKSQWSNPVEITTKDLEAPPPPVNLGLASKQSVMIYNQENGTDYKPAEFEYLIVEWIRIAADISLDGDEESKITGTEAPSSEEALAQFLNNPTVKNMYMVKFNKLTANRVYYIRAKTRLVIKRVENGISQRSYTYVVEISLHADFLDALSIEVPFEADVEGAVYKDSEWSDVALYTETSDGEYDGDKNPNTYPLPHSDFEIIYDSKTSTLTYRFRSNATGNDKLKDNNVDERFISRLVANKTFEYEVDISAYNNTVPYNRVIEFPYSIISAFNERKISLRIKADNLTLTFAPETFMIQDVKNLTGLDKNASFKIILNQNPLGLPVENYISAPHKISTTVSTKTKTVNIKAYAKPVDLKFKITGIYAENATNAGTYIMDENTNGWQRIETAYNMADKTLNAKVLKASAAYSVIGIKTPGAVAGGTVGKMYSVNARLSILDMGTYNENALITVNQFNQITAAALNGSPTVNMNGPMTQEDFNALSKSKLLLSGNGYVPREQALAVLIRLYEIKSGYPVAGYPTLIETSYTDIKNAGKEYQIPLLKAAELGFYRSTGANPKGNFTMGDLVQALHIILNY